MEKKNLEFDATKKKLEERKNPKTKSEQKSMTNVFRNATFI